ncbi:[Pyruvate dehydrogenase [acetyl-transferring]]-phosphatase 1, mitochondrial [Diaporthe australafricana]|uniref:[Pyruvate dehydrogenase [acetyl-transferring]]-phosphatase 1, mitochondrial n=1 Tax=Diaporthe australafricana TaxID=127596 RepID=A0ABR3WXC0_9PEZI
MVQDGYHGLDWQRINYPILSLEEANKVLRRSELSQNPGVQGPVPITRVDSLRLEASHPCQDNFTYETADVGTGTLWHFWGVFDGHAGWQTSTVLSQALVSYVTRSLKQADKADPASIDKAIKDAFLKLDDEIVQGAMESVTNAGSRPRAEIIADIAPAISGSMAVLGIFDPTTSTLRVASVGDSQAVLGLHDEGPGGGGDDASQTWTAVPLSTPQTPDRPDELEKLHAQHPGEPDSDLLTADGKRLLGLPVTRAFGDHRWKWPEEAIADARKKFYGFPARPNAKTPPYLTAEPEISTTVVKKGDFAILATDGLWDTLTPEDAVETLQLWLQDGRLKSPGGARQGGSAQQPESAESVPVFSGDEEPECRVGYPWDWKGRTEDFVVEDDNAATHLARNALGGKRREQFCTILGVLAPHKDDAHDDITVQVLFFGDS